MSLLALAAMCALEGAVVSVHAPFRPPWAGEDVCLVCERGAPARAGYAPQADEGHGAVVSPDRIRGRIHPGVIRPPGLPTPGAVATAPEPPKAPVGVPASGAPLGGPASSGAGDARFVGIAILLLACGVLLTRLARKVRA